MAVKLDSTATTNLATALTNALAAVPAAGTPEEAYKAFMDKLGQGFTQTVGDALGAALGALQESANATAAPDPKLDLIIDLLKGGSNVKLEFSTPSMMVPLTQKISAKQGLITSGNAPAAKGRVNLLGGSVGVTGSYSF